MKKRILKKANALLAAVLALFGVATSCDDDILIPELPCAYGVPYEEYKEWEGSTLVTVEGKVLNETNDWIQGIQVMLDPDGLPVDTLEKNDTSISRWGGDYWVQVVFLDSCQPEKVKLYFNDLDGNSNGGIFQSDSAEVELSYKSSTGIRGRQFVHVNFTKKLKKEQK